jgi:hypothetical protein
MHATASLPPPHAINHPTTPKPDPPPPSNPHPARRRFFQNQIRSEEEFQARKVDLRAAARRRLDGIFQKKGKRLLVDPDDDAFSIGSSELSAWDSDVASIVSLSSCVREWREDARFGAPAEALMQLGLAVTAVSGPAVGWAAACLGGLSACMWLLLPHSSPPH